MQVLTLNVWGLWLASKKRYNRVLHLAEFLANDSDKKHTLDVVCLQEVWCDSDAEVLMSAAKAGGMPYSVHFRSGVFGSGLVTVSRHPIVECAFQPYTAAGDPLAITCGDYLASKGVGWVRVQSPAGPVDVFNTHLHANYSHKYEAKGSSPEVQAAGGGIPKAAADDFAGFRMAQVLELSRFVRGTCKAGSVGTVLAGDLNCKPGTLETAVLQAELPQLRDCWVEAHGPDEAGYTCKAEGNSFKPRRQQPSRIDYVLTTMGVSGCELALQTTSEGHSFSDHFALHARLRLPAPSSPAPEPPAPRWSAPQRRALMDAAHEVVGEGALRCQQTSVAHQFFALVVFMQAFALCLAKPVLSFFGYPINPYVYSALPFVVLVMGAVGAVLMLVGAVADIAQMRALQQALEQLEVAQVALAEGGGGKKGGAAGKAAAAAAGAAKKG